jgi:hypothetical protein
MKVCFTQIEPLYSENKIPIGMLRSQFGLEERLYHLTFIVASKVPQ